MVSLDAWAATRRKLPNRVVMDELRAAVIDNGYRELLDTPADEVADGMLDHSSAIAELDIDRDYLNRLVLQAQDELKMELGDDVKAKK